MFCQLMCPNLRCRKVLRVPQESRGKLIRCQNCHALLRVPVPEGARAERASTETTVCARSFAPLSGAARRVA